MAKHLCIADTIHSSLYSDSYDKLMKFCQKNLILFADKQFPNNSSSLYGNPPHREYRGQWNRYKWSRPETVLGKKYAMFEAGIKPGDIRQGGLGDCYFLCALSSLAEEETLITRLFVETTLNQYGVIGVWLFVNGIWIQYILDEYFPVTETQKGFDFAFSKSVGAELWVLALEKAYAKTYGNYFDIAGGDPVHALRDLTGAPYDRIEDFTNIPKAWAKLKEANNACYVMTCFTKSAETVEAQSADGIVSGHAYSILDVRELVDSRGKPRMILQIRNPWGKFEWNGEFSDNSPLWTPALKKQLNVIKSDDGLFWMPFEIFVQKYEGIGIVKIKPGHVNNCLSVNRSKTNNKTIIHLRINDTIVDTTISIDQIDSKTIDEPDYVYCYFRVTLGRVDGDDKIEFVDTIVSPEKAIFISSTLKRGDYMILIEPYWIGNYAQSYVVGTYSDYHTELEHLTSDQAVYNSIERMIWQSFALKNKSAMQVLRQKTAQQNNLQAPLELYSFTDQNFGCKLYATFNKSDSVAVRATYKVINKKGYDLVAALSSDVKIDMLINPQSVDILLFKMNLTNQSFSLAHQVVAEELSKKTFQKDTRVIELLSQIGGGHSLNNSEQDTYKPRVQKNIHAKQQQILSPDDEQNRLKLIEDHKKQIEKNQTQDKDFKDQQQKIFLDMTKVTPDLNKYLNPETKKIDPFFVVAESFKNINIRGDPYYQPLQTETQTYQQMGTQKYQQFDQYGFSAYSSTTSNGQLAYGSTTSNGQLQGPKKCNIF